MVDGHRFPIFVVESGWFESNTKLFDDDINKLLVGGNGAIDLVALLKWRKLSDNRVSGTIELYKRDNANIARLIQQEVCSRQLQHSISAR